jgi:hypothetical protein
MTNRPASTEGTDGVGWHDDVQAVATAIKPLLQSEADRLSALLSRVSETNVPANLGGIIFSINRAIADLLQTKAELQKNRTAKVRLDDERRSAEAKERRLLSHRPGRSGQALQAVNLAIAQTSVRDLTYELQGKALWMDLLVSAEVQDMERLKMNVRTLRMEIEKLLPMKEPPSLPVQGKPGRRKRPGNKSHDKPASARTSPSHRINLDFWDTPLAALVSVSGATTPLGPALAVKTAMPIQVGTSMADGTPPAYTTIGLPPIEFFSTGITTYSNGLPVNR